MPPIVFADDDSDEYGEEEEGVGGEFFGGNGRKKTPKGSTKTPGVVKTADGQKHPHKPKNPKTHDPKTHKEGAHGEEEKKKKKHKKHRMPKMPNPSLLPDICYQMLVNMLLKVTTKSQALGDHCIFEFGHDATEEFTIQKCKDKYSKENVEYAFKRALAVVGMGMYRYENGHLKRIFSTKNKLGRAVQITSDTKPREVTVQRRARADPVELAKYRGKDNREAKKEYLHGLPMETHTYSKLHTVIKIEILTGPSQEVQKA